MYVMRRFGSEAYPRGAAGSPGAAQPFTQLGLSADAPFIAGASTIIPFDTIVYQSSAFGAFEDVVGNSVFFVPFGVYLVVLQAVVDTTPTQVDISINIQSGSGIDGAGASSALTIAAVTASGVRLASETPFPGHVLPVGILPGILVTGGGNGNILTDTKLFVWQLARFA